MYASAVSRWVIPTIYFVLKTQRFQEPKAQAVPNASVPAPPEPTNMTLDISNVYDINSLSETMQVLQTVPCDPYLLSSWCLQRSIAQELRRPSVGTVEHDQYQRQLRHIYRETQILPPMADCK